MLKCSEKNAAVPVLMWIAALSFFFYQFIARSSFSTVLTEEFMKYFHLDSSGIGGLVSSYHVIYMLMQVPAGVIIDKIGVRVAASIAVIVCVLGIFLFIATSNCYIAGLGQMMQGFGASFAFVASVKTITNWFPADKVSIMCSYTLSVGCLGPVVGGPLVSHLTKHFDWMRVMEVFAVFGIFLSTAIWTVIRDKTYSQKTQHVIASLKIILTSRQIWILSIYSALLYSPISTLGDLWGVSFIKKVYGVDSTIASIANNMLYIGIVIGSPVFAYLAAFMNSYKKPMVVGTTLASVCMGLVVLCQQLSINMVFFLFFLIGFSSGAMLSYPLAMRAFPASISATVFSIINMASMVSGVFLMPFIGYIIDTSWDGTIENGIKVYSADDFRLGLTAVLIFLVISVISALIVEDTSPKESATQNPV